MSEVLNNLLFCFVGWILDSRLLKNQKKFTQPTMRNYLIFFILIYSGQAVCQSNGKVIISEIYSDPTPSNGLPEYEYLELFNGYHESVNLHNWKISDGSATGTILNVVLQPNEYLILCQSASKAHFELFGKVQGLTTWPILNNKSDNITLRNESGEIMDAISYNLDAFPEKEKSNGGWSVEIVDPWLFCRGFENWRFSTHPIGGTPGTENSVYERTPDNVRPWVINYFTPSSNLLELHFNEPMDGNSLKNGNYVLEGNEIIDIMVFEGNQRILLTLKNHMEAGKTYSFQITNILDCNANEIERSILKIIYDISAPELSNIIYTSYSSITCVFTKMLDPTTAGLSTNYSIDNYHPLTAQVIDNNKVLLTSQRNFELEKSYLLKMRGIKDKNGNMIAENSEKEFVFSTAIDSVIIHDPNLISIIFKKPLLFDSLSINKILMDRTLKPEAIAVHQNNPSQASLRFKTALKANSWKSISFSSIYDAARNLLQTPEHSFYYDTRPPQLYKLNVLDSNRLELIFDEKLDLNVAVAVNNFETSPDLVYPHQVSAINDSTLHLVFSTPFINEKTYYLSIDNIQDIYKNKISRKISSSFIFDRKAPHLVAIKVRQSDQLMLKFSEPLAQACLFVSNFNVSPNYFSPVSLFVLPWDSTQVALKFQHRFTEADHIIQILTLKDGSGNQSTGITEKEFSTIHPKIADIEVVSANEIGITFSEDLQMSVALQKDHYVLNDSIKAIKITEISPSEILCKFPQDFKPNTNHELKIEKMEDRYGNQSLQEKTSFIYIKNIINISVLNEQMVSIEYAEPLDESSISVAQFSFHPEPGKPVLITKDANNARLIKILFDHCINENTSYTVEVSGLRDIFGRKIPVEKAVFNYDKTPPAIIHTKCILPGVIEIKFSEPLDKKTAENRYFFSLSKCGYPSKSIVRGTSQEKVWLEFSCQLQKGQEYLLLLSGVRDVQGNSIINQEISFTYQPPREPEYNDLLITEIMPNPTDNKTFTSEYLELFNRTSDTINLSGIRLSDRVKEVLLPEYDLAPNEYVILVPSTTVGDYLQFGEVIGISNWPALNDQDDDLKLINRNSELIFTVSYTDAWYKNSAKKKSHSLEMIDVSNPCAGYYNWTASLDPTGGTPGRENSVKSDNQDLTSPKVLKVTAPDRHNIIVYFNEKLQPNNLEGLFTIDPIIEIKTITFKDLDYEKLLITTISPLELGIQYQISIKSLTDCAGNILKPDDGLATFQVCETGQPQDVLFSEILFNPRAGGVDFIELFNMRAYPIDIKNWILNVSDKPQVISSDHLVINPSDFMVLTTDPEILKADYPKGRADKFFQMKNMQNLVNEQGIVVLTTPADIIMDSLYYSDKMHLPLLKSTKGVSLERLSYEISTVNPYNWKSASENASFATPGFKNSQSKSDHTQKGLFTVSPETFSPDDPGGRNHTFIHYDLESPDFIATISVYDRMGRVIKELAKNESLGTSGSFRWDGYDFAGKRASAGYYIILIQAFNLTGETLKIKEKVAVAH